MAKLPNPDLDVIRSRGAEVAQVRGKVLWRIHSPRSSQALRWDQLRSWGPLVTARHDPWPPPPDDHFMDLVTRGVGYFGFDIPTCLAEVFQATRHISTARGGPQLSAFMPTRPLLLLNLSGTWPIVIGASHLINSGPKNRCRVWAHALREVYPTRDGFLYTGMAGRACVVLFEPPGGYFPTAPAFTKPLSDPGLASRIADAAEQIGYALD